MNKHEFLDALKNALHGLPEDDIQKSLDFYNEMIDDRMEDGISEQDAVSGIGPVEDIIAQIVADTPLARIVKEKIKPKKSLKMWEIGLLVLGSPIWVSLAVAAAVVVFSVYIVLWSAIVTVWAVFGALIGCALGGIVSCVLQLGGGNYYSAVAMLGGGLISAGLAVFLFYGCTAATKGILKFTKNIVLWIKNRFIRGEDAQ